MTAIANLPDLRPSLLLDFANSGRVDPRITFSRASTATYFDNKGVLRTAPTGVPRIDYDPATGKCRGLLVEEQRTNLLTYSEQFDNAAWTKTRSSVTANATIAPDGVLTADKLVEDTTASATHQLNAVSYSATNSTLTASVYVKAAERPSVRIDISNFLNGAATATFNLTNGAISGVGSSTVDYTGVLATITSMGAGWYRCSVTATKGNANANNVVLVQINNGTTNSYTGDGTSGLYIWGAQLEVGSFPTSYIPTTTSQVTRVADSASMTGANFSSWYRQEEGTFAVDYSLDVSSSAFPSAWSVTGTGGDAIYHVVNAGGRNIRYEYRKAGSLEKDIVISNTSANVKTAFCYGQGSISQSTLGMAVTSSSPVSIIDVGNFNIGQRNNTARLNGHIRRITYYPRRIANEQLQALTTI